MKIILSSKSTARKRALDILGLEYEIIPSGFDEATLQDDNPRERTRKLAEAKAKQVGDGLTEPALVIGGDMFTVLKGEPLEKPSDLEDAHRMLRLLSGKTAEVIGAVSVYNNQTKRVQSAVSVCDVTFRELSDHEIDAYIEQYPVLTFAAAFDADGVSRFAESVSGAYNLATGFSVNDLVLLLREEGVVV